MKLYSAPMKTQSVWPSLSISIHVTKINTIFFMWRHYDVIYIKTLKTEKGWILFLAITFLGIFDFNRVCDKKKKKKQQQKNLIFLKYCVGCNPPYSF